jgi:hypothetical protein
LTPHWAAALLLALGVLAAACTVDAPAPITAAVPPGATAAATSANSQLPADRVASTGAVVPANGRPTLVFVDAIW